MYCCVWLSLSLGINYPILLLKSTAAGVAGFVLGTSVWPNSPSPFSRRCKREEMLCERQKKGDSVWKIQKTIISGGHWRCPDKVVEG